MTDITRSADDPADIETVEVGYFRYRERKGAPWQPLRIMRESGRWVALLNGNVIEGSGATLAKDIPFLLWRSPFAPITEAEYHTLLDQYERAPANSPLKRPGDAIDRRASPAAAIYRGRQ